MRVKDYEYPGSADEYVLTEKRKNELIRKVKEQVQQSKNEGKNDTIALYKVLAIGKNDEEYDFLYNWIDENDIILRGINITLSGEFPNFEHIPRMGKRKIPETIKPEEQIKMFIQLKQAKEQGLQEYMSIRDQLVVGNMALVKWIANWRAINKLEIPTDDKEQIGMIGLIDAVDKFDVTKGFEFSTYATKVIYYRIVCECYKQSPKNQDIIKSLGVMEEVEDYFFNRLGREPTDKELAEIMGIPVKKVVELSAFRIQNNESQTIEELNDSGSSDKEVINLIENLPDGEHLTYYNGEYYSQGGYVDDLKPTVKWEPKGECYTAQIAEAKCLRGEIQDILATLSERDRMVLTLLFGFVDGHTRTPKEVAQIFGISNTRIGQIKNRAIRKLRGVSRERSLIDYLNDSDENLR